ncbi:hypothetical protein BS47DRAFT_1344353, partial [Hydnum rufescens UP504]
MAATHIYQLAFITGFGVSTIIYTALNYLWPPLGKGTSNGFEEIDYTDWEHGGRPPGGPNSKCPQTVAVPSKRIVGLPGQIWKKGILI